MRLQANSPALALGFQETDLNQIGLQAGFPFNVTNILGQSVSKIRLAANFSRLLKVRTGNSQLVPSSGSSFLGPLQLHGFWQRANTSSSGCTCSVRPPPQSNGTAIELRLDAPDGTLIGSLPYGQTTCRITTTTGLHDLFLVFPNANIQALDWFVFKPRIIWTGGGSDNKWTTAANWSSPFSAGEALYFGASSRTSPSNDLAAGNERCGNHVRFRRSRLHPGRQRHQSDRQHRQQLRQQSGHQPADQLSGSGSGASGHRGQACDAGRSLQRRCRRVGQARDRHAGAQRQQLHGRHGHRERNPGFSASGAVRTLRRSRIGTTAGASAVLDLSHGLTDRVLELYIDGVRMSDGTYGSSASGATYKDDSAFRGTGILRVQSGPCPPTYSTRADGYTLATFDITGTGVWTIPANVTSVEVLVVGGGGGSASKLFQRLWCWWDVLHSALSGDAWQQRAD